MWSQSLCQRVLPGLTAPHLIHFPMWFSVILSAIDQMYSIRWGTKSAAATLYIREPVGGTHISCWKLIFNIFPRSITLEQKLDSCLFTEVCASVCARVCVRLFCPCCLNVTWCFVGISCELGCSPNQYPAAYGLSACPTHTHIHLQTYAFSWSLLQLRHRTPGLTFCTDDLNTSPD